MEIRRLETQDAPIFKEIRMEALKTDPIAFAADYSDEINHPVSLYEEWIESKIVYGAFETGELIGVSSFTWEKSKRKLCHGGMIQSVFVKPNYRRQGIGTSLFNAIIDNLPKEIEKVIIYVVKKNEKAKSMYEALGFQQYGLEEKALKIDGQYYDEYLMVKFIK